MNSQAKTLKLLGLNFEVCIPKFPLYLLIRILEHLVKKGQVMMQHRFATHLPPCEEMVKMLLPIVFMEIVLTQGFQAIT